MYNVMFGAHSIQYSMVVYAAPMPICNSEPRLTTSSWNSNNITFVISWNYSFTEGNHLSRVALSYLIPVRDYIGRVSTRTVSETLQTNETSKMITISSMNVNPGTFIVNITVSNSQGSNTVMCPPLHLGKAIIK